MNHFPVSLFLMLQVITEETENVSRCPTAKDFFREVRKSVYLCSMITPLSILIPTFNRECVELVRTLSQQGARIKDLCFEIVVLDDCSTDSRVKATNRAILQIPHCRLLELEANVGRTRIRNLLAQEAQYPTLLYLDSDVQIVHSDFIARYLEYAQDDVVCGGVCIRPSDVLAGKNLRYCYEMSCLQKFDVAHRQKHPYQGFRTTNFMVRREVMLTYPFNERIRRYGYEDVFWGKTLKAAHIGIFHIDNSVAVDDFEPNDVFLKKTDEGLRTLLPIADELSGYSLVVDYASMLARWHVAGLLRFLYRQVKPILMANLLGHTPSVVFYNVYRLGEFLLLQHKENRA